MRFSDAQIGKDRARSWLQCSCSLSMWSTQKTQTIDFRFILYRFARMVKHAWQLPDHQNDWQELIRIIDKAQLADQNNWQGTAADQRDNNGQQVTCAGRRSPSRDQHQFQWSAICSNSADGKSDKVSFDVAGEELLVGPDADIDTFSESLFNPIYQGRCINLVPSMEGRGALRHSKHATWTLRVRPIEVGLG